MASKSLRFVLIANWIFSCFLSFAMVMYWDEDTPLPVQAGILVREWDENRSAAELRAEIERFAIDRKITVGRLKDDFGGERRGRTLYLVPGDPSVPAAEWLRGDYEDFTQSLTTSVRAFSEAGDRDPTGAYAVFSDYTKATELADFFASQGMVVTRQFDRWSLNPLDLFLQDEQVTALGMMMLVSIAVTAAGVLVAARAYGVKRMLGLGYGGLLSSDLRTAAVYWLSTGVVTAGLALGALAAYNGLSGFGFYLVTAFVINCVLTATAIGSHALVLALLMRLRVLAAVKGELPGRTASAVAYTLRVVAVIATVVLAQRAVATAMDVQQRGDVLASYSKLGSTSTINLGNVWSSGDRKQVLPVVGRWLREQDRAGHVVIAGRKRVEIPGDGSGNDLIYANENFVRDQPIRLADGGSFAGGEKPVLLIPQSLWNRRDEITETVRNSRELRREGAPRVELGQIRTASGQDVFTYSSDPVGPMSQGNVAEDQSFATDPVVVFLPSKQGLLTEDAYTSFASQGRMMFTDPQVVADAVDADPALGKFVVSVTPVLDRAAAEHRKVVQNFRLALFGALAGMLVLLITGVGAVLIHTRRNAQWIFARHVSGWRFVTTHRALLAFEAIALAVVVGWLPYQAWSVNRDIAEYQSRGTPTPIQPMVLGLPEWIATGLLAALTVVGVLVALTRAHRRVVRDGASEA